MEVVGSYARRGKVDDNNGMSVPTASRQNRLRLVGTCKIAKSLIGGGSDVYAIEGDKSHKRLYRTEHVFTKYLLLIYLPERA